MSSGISICLWAWYVLGVPSIWKLSLCAHGLIELDCLVPTVLFKTPVNAYGKEDPLLTLTDYSKEKYGRDIYTAAYTTIGL